MRNSNTQVHPINSQKMPIYEMTPLGEMLSVKCLGA